jgi:hypothetical protein
VLAQFKHADGMPALRFARNHPASPQATILNIPVPSAAQDLAPESDLDQDQPAANSDHPSQEFPA